MKRRPLPWLLAAVVLAVACRGPEGARAPWTVVALSVEAPIGERAGAPPVSRCDRDRKLCKPVTTGERFRGEGRIEVAKGARVSLELDGAMLDLDEGAVVLEGGETRTVEVAAGTATLHRETVESAQSSPTWGGLSLRAGGRDITLDAGAPTTVAVRAVTPDQAAVTVEHGVVRLNGEATAEPTVLRSGETATLAPDRVPSKAAAWTGEAVPVDGTVPGESRSEVTRSSPRGLGTMTARAPGTTDVVAGVRLSSHRVHAVVRDGFARTEIEEEFRNETSRVLEGRYVFPLPSGASISRLALDVGGKLVEGEIVEKDRAATIFRSIVDDTVRPRDPALLEWVTGGEFSLKVFPIPPNGSRRVVLAYDEALRAPSGRVQYVYPLTAGADRAVQIDDFSIDVTLSDSLSPVGEVTTPHYAASIGTSEDGVTLGFAAKAFVPERDFVAVYRREPRRDVRVTTYVPDRAASPPKEPEGGFFAIRVTADLPDPMEPPELGRRARAVVIDSSQSQSKETLAGEGTLALSLLRRLDRDERFVLLACDSACQSFPEDGLADVTDAALDGAKRWVEGLSPSGSSDLGGALGQAARRLDADGSGQLVHIGDGQASSGELAVDTIARLLRPVLARSKIDLRLLGAGRSVDEPVLAGLARALGGAYESASGSAPLARRAQEIAMGLRRPLLVDARIELPAALEEVRPTALANVRIGEEILVVGKLGPGEMKGDVTLRGTLGGAPYARTLPLRWGERVRHNPLVPRLWAEARIDELSGSNEKTAIDEVVTLSKRYHVMSRHTSLLVLENDRMFAEVGVKRTTRVAGDQSDHAFGAFAEAERSRSTSDHREAGQIGMIGVLGGSTSAPAAPWGRDDKPANDLSSRGNMWGAEIGDAFGSGGLGLSGVGEGGGGRGEGIGLGSVGSIGHGAGPGSGQGFGSGRVRTAPAPSTRGRVSAGGANVSGRVPPEVIQSIVRRSFGRLRACYERGLAKDPTLAGRVAVRFVIGRDGSVANVGSGGSDLADASVVACILAAFRGMSFPEPEGGIVTVVYPIRFSPEPARVEPPAPAARIWSDPAPGPSVAHEPASDGWMREGEDALGKLRRAVAETPTSRAKHDALIRGLVVHGRFTEALEAARRFAELDPDLPQARELLANAAAATGDGALAASSIDAAVETVPRGVLAHVRAARAFEAAGDERRACAHWRSLAELVSAGPGAEDAAYEALRCRARAGAERLEVLAEVRAIERPSALVTRLLGLLEAGTPPAYDASASSAARPGQFEASIACARGTEGCPILVVITPAGRVFSPWTPATARSDQRSVALPGVTDGTYRTLLVGGAPDATGELSVRALGASRRFPITHGGPQTVAATRVRGS